MKNKEIIIFAARFPINLTQITKDLKLFLFPFLLIGLYEVFAIQVYKRIGISSSQLPGSSGNDFYNYFIILQAIISFIGSILSDHFCRKKLLTINLVIAGILFSLIHLGHQEVAFRLSPLFFSTPIARAALIDNHQHISIKNLMCFSYIMVSIPWCAFSKLSKEWGDPFLTIGLFVILILSWFWFKDKQRKTTSKNPYATATLLNIFRIRKVLFYLALLAAQVVFFVIIGKIEVSGYGDNLFNLLGAGTLCGSILCLFSNEDHKVLISMTYRFLVFSAIGAFLVLFFWGEQVWQVSLAWTGVLGGYYLPIVTEQIASFLGKEKRGLACGLVELIINIASIIAVVVTDVVKPSANLIISSILVSLSITAYSFQKVYSHLSKSKTL